jgi:hypothetical protein
MTPLGQANKWSKSDKIHRHETTATKFSHTLTSKLPSCKPVGDKMNIIEEKQSATTTPGSLPKISTVFINHPPDSGIGSEAALEKEDGHDKLTATNTGTSVERDTSQRTFQRGPRFCGIMGNLIICNLVPLRDRGAYLALIYCAITIGNGIGPSIGGIIVQSTTWRWVFYMNLPLAGVSLVLLVAFLKVSYHMEPVVQKLKRIDYLGESIFIGSVVAITVPLAYAGVKHPCSAWQTILPLVLGFTSLGIFLAYEGSRFCLEPTIPLRLFTNRTIVAACILALLNPLLMVWVMYFLPVYFQAVLGSYPARSGVQLLPTILIIIPFAAISAKSSKYRVDIAPSLSSNPLLQSSGWGFSLY